VTDESLLSSFQRNFRTSSQKNEMTQTKIKARLEAWERPVVTMDRLQTRISKATERKRTLQRSIISKLKHRRNDLPQADLKNLEEEKLESKLQNAQRRKDILLTQVINSASDANKKKREKVSLLKQVDERSRGKQKLEILMQKQEAQERKELTLLSRKEKAKEANVLVEERVQEIKRERSFSQSELACKIENKQISSEIRKDNRGKEKGGSDDKLEKAKAFKLEQRSSLSSLKEKIDLRIQNASERRAMNLRTRVAKASNDKKAKRVDLKRKDEELRGLEVQSNQRERLETAERNRNIQLSSKKPSFRAKDSPSLRRGSPEKMFSEERSFAESHSEMPISYVVSSPTATASSAKVEEPGHNETVCLNGTFMFSLTMLIGWFVDKIKQFVWKRK